jgi:hypothetical protein
MRCEEIERFDAARARTLRALFEAEGSMSDKKIAPRAYCAGRRRHYRGLTRGRTSPHRFQLQRALRRRTQSDEREAT